MDEIEVGLLRLSALVDQTRARREEMTDDEWNHYHLERGWVKGEDGLWSHPAALAAIKEQYGLE